MKRGKTLLGLLSLTFLIQLVSAEEIISSLRELILYFDPETIQIVLTFLVSFVILFWAFKKYFKKDRTTAGLVSFCLSLGITYWMEWQNIELNLLDFDVGFFNINEIAWELEYFTGLSIQTLVVMAVAVIFVILIAKNFDKKKKKPAPAPAPAAE